MNAVTGATHECSGENCFYLTYHNFSKSGRDVSHSEEFLG